MNSEYVLYNTVKDFITNNKISCPECIYQCDWVIENSLPFIEVLCEQVGYYEEEK